jgi:Flp pilus assembly pilin Flp
MTPMNLAPLRRHARDERGQAIVELALISVVLVTLVFGGVEFGRMLNAWAIVTQASREGARTAAAQCSLNAGCDVQVQAAIEGALVGLDVPAARWDMDAGPYVSGAPVAVRVEYDVTPVLPLIAAFVPGGVLTVTGDTTMRLE